MKKILLFFLISQFSFSQKQEIEKQLIEGDKAFLANDFELAKKIYSNVIALDSLNKKAWYNLAASELNLGENDAACQHLYKSYSLKNEAAGKLIHEYCGELQGNTISIFDVDEKPKFMYKGEVFLLYENSQKGLDQKYIKVLTKEIKSSQIISRMNNGKAYVKFHINRKGEFDGEIMRLDVVTDDKEKIKTELIRIFKTIVSYIPAMYKGRVVETWDYIVLPINFE